MASSSRSPALTTPRNPTPLSFAQESQVRELYHKRVRGQCADQIRDFAACAHGRTFSAPWACRGPRLAMNACMISHATREEEDAAREEWFATREKRTFEREEKEKKRREQEKFHNEWWGIPQRDDGTKDSSQSPNA